MPIENQDPKYHKWWPFTPYFVVKMIQSIANIATVVAAISVGSSQLSTLTVLISSLNLFMVSSNLIFLSIWLVYSRGRYYTWRCECFISLCSIIILIFILTRFWPYYNTSEYLHEDIKSLLKASLIYVIIQCFVGFVKFLNYKVGSTHQILLCIYNLAKMVKRKCCTFVTEIINYFRVRMLLHVLDLNYSEDEEDSDLTSLASSDNQIEENEETTV